MLKQKVFTALPELKMSEPVKCSKMIAIVGFSNKYDINNIMKDQLSQVILKVSPALRHTLSNLGNKLFIGMRSCVIYDRAQVVRCYNCQEFGHIKPNCPHKAQCSKCFDSHDSRDYTESNPKYINCHKAGNELIDHAASSLNCPQFKLELKKLQKTPFKPFRLYKSLEFNLFKTEIHIQ